MSNQYMGRKDHDPWGEWRGRILDIALCGALVGAVGGMLPHAMTHGLPGRDFPLTGLWLWAMGVTCLVTALLMRPAPLRIRSLLCVVGLVLLGWNNLMAEGYGGSGRLWLMSSPLAAALLLGGAEAVVTSLVAVIILGVALYPGGMPMLFGTPRSDIHKFHEWAGECLVFSVLSVTVTLCLCRVQRMLERAIWRQEEDRHSLEEEREKLSLANTRLVREVQERERVEMRLLESSQRVIGIVRHARDIIYTLNMEGQFTFMSPAVQDMMGYAPQEVTGRHFAEFVHPEDVETCQHFLREVLEESQENSEILFRVRHKSGDWRWCSSTGGIMPPGEAGDGLPPGFVGILQDVTESKIAADKLAHSERMYRLLAENSADVIFTTDKNYDCTYISPAMERLTGYEARERLFRPIHELLTLQDREIAEKFMRDRLADELRGERDNEERMLQFRLLHKQGRLIWTETMFTPLRGDDGEFQGVLGVVRDITRRKEAELELDQARKDIEALVEAISAILVFLDADNRIKRWNRSAELVFSLPAREALGKRLGELPLDWDNEALRRSIETSRKEFCHLRIDEVRFGREDGSEGMLGLTCNPVAGGGVLLLARDITEAMSRQIRESHEQKMQSIGRLAAGVAHEINTPVQYLGYNATFLEEAFQDLLALATTYGELQATLERNEDAAALLDKARERLDDCDLGYLEQEVPKALAHTRKGLEQIGGIVKAMQQLSHPGRLVSASKSMVDCNSIVTNAVTVTRNEWKKYSDVTLELERGLPKVRGWAPELGQVVVNLVVNAAHANEETRENRSRRQKARIVCGTRLEKNAVAILVADDGPGISEDIRVKIFDPFFTTKEVGKGSGQGLAIAHAIVVEQHGGEIGFAPGEDGGTVFTVRLPQEPEEGN